MTDSMAHNPRTGEHAQILAAVGEAWRMTLPHDRFALDRELGETGIDSLKAMELVLRLERQLGRKVPYGLLGPTTTPASLAAGIVAGAAIDPAGDRPPLFFMTGLGGHQLRMVEAWQAGLPQVVFVTVDAPGLDHPPALLTDLEATAGRVADDIVRRQPSGAIRLSGYSFGGALAYEVARHLVARGRRIAFLGLIDVFPAQGIVRRVANALHSPRQLLRKLMNRVPRVRRAGRLRPNESWLMDAAVRMDAMRLASRLARRKSRASSDTAVADRLALHHLRLMALRKWRPAPLAVPALLVATDDGILAGSPAFWRGLIPDIAMVCVPGTHQHLAAGLSAESLVEAFERALPPDSAWADDAFPQER